MNEDFRSSILRESVLEHFFIANCLNTLWQRNCRVVEVLRSENDSFGYDIVIVAGDKERHIQLKSSHKKARTSKQKVHRRLQSKPSGCVVWIVFDAENMAEHTFLWFGSDPGKRLALPEAAPNAKHTKGNATGHKTERPEIAVVSKSSFVKVDDYEELVTKLFGSLTPEQNC